MTASIRRFDGHAQYQLGSLTTSTVICTLPFFFDGMILAAGLLLLTASLLLDGGGDGLTVSSSSEHSIASHFR